MGNDWRGAKKVDLSKVFDQHAKFGKINKPKFEKYGIIIKKINPEKSYEYSNVKFLLKPNWEIGKTPKQIEKREDFIKFLTVSPEPGQLGGKKRKKRKKKTKKRRKRSKKHRKRSKKRRKKSRRRTRRTRR